MSISQSELEKWARLSLRDHVLYKGLEDALNELSRLRDKP